MPDLLLVASSKLHARIQDEVCGTLQITQHRGEADEIAACHVGCFCSMLSPGVIPDPGTCPTSQSKSCGPRACFNIHTSNRGPSMSRRRPVFRTLGSSCRQPHFKPQGFGSPNPSQSRASTNKETTGCRGLGDSCRPCCCNGEPSLAAGPHIVRSCPALHLLFAFEKHATSLKRELIVLRWLDCSTTHCPGQTTWAQKLD